MAWYYGTFACGHEGRVNVIGPGKDRQWKIDKMFSEVCEECKKKQIEEENKKAAAISKEYELPELNGTDKQILWGNSIRLAFYEHWNKYKIPVDDIIMSETSSRFWIDNRDIITNESFLMKYRKDMNKKEAVLKMIDDDTIKPSEIKHDGVVEIISKQDNICLIYEKDQDFIEIVKKMHYKWNGVWERRLSERTGTFNDRAAEIGHILLNNGFCICIHDNVISENAIIGNYEPEHTRWICSRIDTSLLTISWEGRDNDLYQAARKIKGSSYDGSIVVDVSHYQQIKEFANKYDFWFTTAAQEKIAEYIRQMESIPSV